MKNIAWPINVLALSKAYNEIFPKGLHIRICIEIGFGILNEQYEIDAERLVIAEAEAEERRIFVSRQTLREYARAHIQAIKFLGPEHDLIDQKFKKAQERGVIPIALRGVQCLITGGINDWTQITKIVLETCVQEIAKLREDRLKTRSQKRREMQRRFELLQGTSDRLQEELEACQGEREELKRIRDELRQVFAKFMEDFNLRPFLGLVELFEYLPLIKGFLPEEGPTLLHIPDEISQIQKGIIKPTALLFGFPEEGAAKRRIKYSPDFLFQAAKEFSRSVNGMSVLRDTLGRFAKELDVHVKNPKQAKHEFPFDLLEGFEKRDVRILRIAESWTIYYLLKRSEKRTPIRIHWLQKNK